MTAALKQQLFAKLTKPVLTPVTVNGVDCHVKQWTERERIVYSQLAKEFEKQSSDEGASSTLASQTIAMSLADEDGNLLFSQDDAEELTGLPTLEFQRLFNFIVESQTGGSVDAKKNLPTTQDSASTSSSPESSSTPSPTSSNPSDTAS